MCALCDPPGSERSTRDSGHPALPDRGALASSAGCHGGADEAVGVSVPARCRVLAAGVAVALCLAWAGTARAMSGPATPGGPAVRAMALVGFAGEGAQCLQAPGRSPRRVRGLELLRRGSPRAITAADAACLLADSGFLVRRLSWSSWRASVPGRIVVWTLAVRTAMPWGRARLKHRQPVADGNAGGMQRPDAAAAHLGRAGIRVLAEPGPGWRDGLAGAVPPGVFSGIPPPGCVMAGADGLSLVAGPAARGCKACGDIGGSGGHLGCGDRASLPGRPARSPPAAGTSARFSIPSVPEVELQRPVLVGDRHHDPADPVDVRHRGLPFGGQAGGPPA